MGAVDLILKHLAPGQSSERDALLDKVVAEGTTPDEACDALQDLIFLGIIMCDPPGLSARGSTMTRPLGGS